MDGPRPDPHGRILTLPGRVRSLPTVLKENRHVRQEPGKRRRWFEDDELDLIVWLDAQGAVEGFQLCRAARALTWRQGAGFAHGCVDEGDASPLKNLTPIVVPDGPAPWAELLEQFTARSANLEAWLRELILARLAART